MGNNLIVFFLHSWQNAPVWLERLLWSQNKPFSIVLVCQSASTGIFEVRT